MKLLAVVFVISKYVCIIAKHDLSSQQIAFSPSPPWRPLRLVILRETFFGKKWKWTSILYPFWIFWCLKLCGHSISFSTPSYLHCTPKRSLHFCLLFVRRYLSSKWCQAWKDPKRMKYAYSFLCPGLNASIVQLVLHIWQNYLTFSYYFIFDRIVCVLVTFYQWGHCDAYDKELESH